MAVGASTRAARLPREERREHFLDAAAQLVNERGIDSVTMEAVAAQAGVSKGLGYAYFPNRGEMLAELFDREMAVLDGRVRSAMESAGSLEDRIRATVRTWYDAVSERGRLLGALLQADLEGPLIERRKRRQTAVEDYWGRTVAEELGVDRTTATAASAILLTGAYGALELWLRKKVPRRELEETYVRLAIGGLEALAPEAPGQNA